MKKSNKNPNDVFESQFSVRGQRRDSNNVSFSRKILKTTNNNTLYLPKKISSSKDQSGQFKNKQQTKTVLKNFKHGKLNNAVYSFTDGYQVDKIFSDLMKNDCDSIKGNKYINQIGDNFLSFKIISLNIYLENHKKDLNKDALPLIENHTFDCKT